MFEIKWLFRFIGMDAIFIVIQISCGMNLDTYFRHGNMAQHISILSLHLQAFKVLRQTQLIIERSGPKLKLILFRFIILTFLTIGS